MQNDELIARLQAATGWDDDLDLALAEWAQDNNTATGAEIITIGAR